MTKSSSWKPVVLLPVFAPAVIVLLLIVIGTISNPELAGQVFSEALAYVTQTFGWFYMLGVASFLIFIVIVALSSWGNIKLGPDHAEPQYPFLSWFAMLFSAGYGVALLFFGVAEPVLHYASPPEGAAETLDAASQAMQIAFFHWGFHLWAIYGLVGLVLAYFSFRHGLPLSMRSALYPLIGKKIYGPIGHTVDTVAILGTLLGLATTLGISVTQINAGANYLWPSVEVSTTFQVTAIALITGLALLSVLAGMDKGVKRLSMLNMAIAITLMVFVFVVGPSIFILETAMQNTGSYLNNIIERTLNLQAYSRSDWIGNWTLFVFGWSIAWAPFVGLFIAKISRGRTIRQFVAGVLIVPTTVTFLWFSIFGDTALYLIMEQGYTALITEVQNDNAIALFKLFEHLPLTSVTSLLAVCLIVTFFVTSSDSAALVIDSLASGGALHTPTFQKAFWAVMQGVLASVLLLAGGLKALQTMSVISALPFTLIMMLSAIGLWRALTIEGHRTTSLSHQKPSVQQGFTSSVSWQNRLSSIVSFPNLQQVDAYIKGSVLTAMQKISEDLNKKGWPSSVSYDAEAHRAFIEISKGEKLDFIYDVRLCEYPLPEFAYANATLPEDTSQEQLYYQAEVFLRRGGQSYDVYGVPEAALITDILDQLEKYLHFRHLSPEILPWKMAEHDEMLTTPEFTDSGSPTTETSNS
ncbi:choline transporter [Thiopseudomonas alkaliphila]|uniref:BCCT family transporter n=1 Tax=Thiopseudomonas alkaliphila TaxID=1697053 RepID=UPI00069F8A7F|nr:BCCT family transporter [Thiopseudomonas alkaliphila]AKX56158.1 choline transporter [Thiopseudomonas alkaliphila]